MALPSWQVDYAETVRGILKNPLTGPRWPLLCSGSSSALSLSPQSSSGDLDNGDRVVVPLDKGHGEHPGQVLAWLLVAARMILFLVVMSLALSLPPQLSCGGLIKVEFRDMRSASSPLSLKPQLLSRR